MTMIEFFKYHGTGNDFIIIDNRAKMFITDTEKIKKMCHRRFGIGADGLMLLENSDKYDFIMRYFNSDGNEGSMCGNGGRSITKFASDLGIINNNAIFLASDGVHKAEINDGIISLLMNNVNEIKTSPNSYFINTGSPHHIEFIENVEEFDVFNRGQEIRNNKQIYPLGTNVNFVEVFENYIYVRTFERGVEDETFSCGTGVVASAIAYSSKFNKNQTPINIKTKGGNLSVRFTKKDNTYCDIWLTGPALKVYKGIINI